MIHKGLWIICPHCEYAGQQNIKEFNLFTEEGKDVRYTVDRCTACSKTFSIQIPSGGEDGTQLEGLRN